MSMESENPVSVESQYPVSVESEYPVSVESENHGVSASGDRYTMLFLQVVGGVSLLAFLAAVMPEQWMVQTARVLGFDPFPSSPLTFYLARNLSLLYGFVGVLLILISFDLERYRPLVWYVAIGTVSFGVLQLVVNFMAGLPTWWIWGESGSTFCGGLLLYWIQRRQT